MEVVINNCFGGFSLSCEALKLAIERGAKGVEVYTEEQYYGKSKKGDLEHFADGYYVSTFARSLHKDGKVFSYDSEVRDDPILVQIVKELGDKANGMCASLKVVDIPDGVEWTVEEYDGNEHIAEVHRTWG